MTFEEIRGEYVDRINALEAEVARLEELILAWVVRYESDGFTGMGTLLTEGRRIRAQRELPTSQPARAIEVCKRAQREEGR